jgi:hypothetical protein
MAILGVIEPEDEGTTFLPNIWDYLPNNRAPSGRLQFLIFGCFWWKKREIKELPNAMHMFTVVYCLVVVLNLLTVGISSSEGYELQSFMTSW